MKVKEMICRVVGKAANKTAKDSANQTCLWWLYQPKVPSKVQKLKKF